MKATPISAFRAVPLPAVEGSVPQARPESDATTAPEAQSGRPSIAVLPFHLVGDAGPYAAIADALPHELITELSRLRWLFVTARGSSFLEQIKKDRVYEPLTAHLHSAESAPALPAIAAFDGRRRVILVRTTHVAELREGGGRVDALSKAGSRQKAAELLGVSPRTLRYKIARLRSAGIPIPRCRETARAFGA